MERLIRALPPLKSMLAFEAVVRLGSVTAAARELGSTQPAVSQQLRALEEAVGGPLFVRRGRCLVPNDEGRAFYEPVSEALWQLAVAADDARRRTGAQRLSIGANFGFAHLWLMPRFGALRDAFPDAELRVVTSDRDDGPEVAGCDINIRFGRFEARRRADSRLFGEHAFPVFSPAFARRIEGLASARPEQLVELPLLHLDEDDPRWLDWKSWFAHFGVKVPRLRPTLLYNNYPLIVNAAQAGEGIALGWSGLVDANLESGTLARLPPTVRRDDHGYLVSVPRGGDTLAGRIAGWIVRQCRSADP